MNTQIEGQNLMIASNQWATRPADERFQSLEDLRASVAARRMRSRSTDLDLTAIEARTEGEKGIIINSEIQPCTPSHWAFGQLAAAVKAPAAYLRTLPNELAVKNINHGLKNSGRDLAKFMTVASEGPDAKNVLQAVTSPSYGRIWDADVVEAVQRVVEKSGGKFHNPMAYKVGRAFMSGEENIEPSGLYASDHDVFIFMIDGGSLLEAGERAKFNRGFITWNSETGARTFGLMTFIFNVVCGNHIIWGAQDVNQLVIRHTKGGPYRFDSEAAPLLKAYTEASEKPIIDAARNAQAYLLPELAPQGGVSDDLMNWARKHGKFTQVEVTEAIRFAKSEEGECRNLWQLIQGFTAYARGFDFIDARVDLEKRAGKLLDIVAS